MPKVISSTEETLELKKDLKVLRISDLGCSVGPKTFFCVNNIIEAVKNKIKTQGNDQQKVPKFDVFFNDNIGNDFNTISKPLPPNKQYMAVGVPGSFHDRIFPKSSMNLMHSSIALQWLTNAPEEATKEDSPLWNKGRVTYALSSIQIGESFRTQFLRDMEAFFRARSEELASGGLLLIIMPCRADGALPSESAVARRYEHLGDKIADMVKEGLVSEGLADSFNIPFFFPTAAEMNQVMSSNKNLSTEIIEVTYNDPVSIRTPEDVQSYSLNVRAVIEGMLRKHFGPDLIIELFDRYCKKLEAFSKTLEVVPIQNVVYGS